MPKTTKQPSPYYRHPNNLKKYREQAGYTQKEVAFILGGPQKRPSYPIQNNLQKYREAAGYSIEKIATKLGVKPGTVKKWESGMSQPKSIYFLKMCNLYNADNFQIYPELMKSINKEIAERIRLLKKLKRK